MSWELRSQDLAWRVEERKDRPRSLAERKDRPRSWEERKDRPRSWEERKDRERSLGARNKGYEYERKGGGKRRWKDRLECWSEGQLSPLSSTGGGSWNRKRRRKARMGPMGMVMMGTRHGPTRNLPSRIPRKIGCFEGNPWGGYVYASGWYYVNGAWYPQHGCIFSSVVSTRNFYFPVVDEHCPNLRINLNPRASYFKSSG